MNQDTILKNKRRIVTFLTLLAGIALWILLETYVSFSIRGDSPLGELAAFYGNDILYFLVNGLVILPLLFRSRKTLPAALVLLVANMFLHFTVTLMTYHHFHPVPGAPAENMRKIYAITSGYRTVLVGIYSIVYAGARHLIRAEKEKGIRENSYLKSLLNPHHLLNSLYYAKVMVYTSPQKAAGMLELLSRSSAFALKYLDSDGKILLSEETEQIERVIEMHALRFDGRFYVRLLLNIDRQSQPRIYPMLLLGLVENVLKYGVLDDPAEPAVISLSFDGKELVLSTCNKRNNNKDHVSMGIGLKSTRLRLQRLYRRRHSLMISDEHGWYKLILRIDL